VDAVGKLLGNGPVMIKPLQSKFIKLLLK